MGTSTVATVKMAMIAFVLIPLRVSGVLFSLGEFSLFCAIIDFAFDSIFTFNRVIEVSLGDFCLGSNTF